MNVGGRVFQSGDCRVRFLAQCLDEASCTYGLELVLGLGLCRPSIVTIGFEKTAGLRHKF